MIADLAIVRLPNEHRIASKISRVSGLPGELIEVRLSVSRPLFEWNPWGGFLRYDVRFNLPGEPQITAEFGPYGHLRVYRGEPSHFKVVAGLPDQRLNFAIHVAILIGFIRNIKQYLGIRYTLFGLEALPCLTQMRNLEKRDRDN